MRECTCKLGADYCEDGLGVFGPLGNGGSCAVRQCENQRPQQLYDREKSYWEEESYNYGSD